MVKYRWGTLDGNPQKPREIPITCRIYVLDCLIAAILETTVLLKQFNQGFCAGLAE